jgi:hypothetical protein
MFEFSPAAKDRNRVSIMEPGMGPEKNVQFPSRLEYRRESAPKPTFMQLDFQHNEAG